MLLKRLSGEMAVQNIQKLPLETMLRDDRRTVVAFARIQALPIHHAVRDCEYRGVNRSSYVDADVNRSSVCGKALLRVEAFPVLVVAADCVRAGISRIFS